jgi:broad specificity phosphatase PhoE
MYLARHGQTMFNVVFGETKQDPGIEDPPLTEEGYAQADVLAEQFAELDISRIVSSPYTRALQTARTVANRLDLSVTVDAHVRERTAYVCDVGTVTTSLAVDWPHLDFAHLEEVWWNRVEETLPEFHVRCETFRRTMAAVEDWDRIAVITHWGVIRSLTGKRVGNAELVRCDPREPHPPMEETWP